MIIGAKEAGNGRDDVYSPKWGAEESQNPQNHRVVIMALVKKLLGENKLLAMSLGQTIAKQHRIYKAPKR